MSPMAERHGIIRHNPMLINGCLANNSPYLKQKNCLLQEWLNLNLQGVPERIFFLEKGKPPLQEHSFAQLLQNTSKHIAAKIHIYESYL